MAMGMQKTEIIGNLGRDPELKHTQTGTKVCNFSVAVNEKWNDKETTAWWNVVVFDKKAELCNQYLRKGSLVYVSGKPEHQQYEARDGEKRCSMKVLAHEVIFLDRKRDSADDEPRHREPEQPPLPGPAISDDDIPF